MNMKRFFANSKIASINFVKLLSRIIVWLTLMTTFVITIFFYTIKEVTDFFMNLFYEFMDSIMDNQSIMNFLEFKSFKK